MIIGLAIAATTLSVAVMIVALSFVNGFQQVISTKVFNFWGHVRVTQSLEDPGARAEEAFFPANDSIRRALQRMPGVVAVESYATKSALLKNSSDMESVLLKGVDSAYEFNRLSSFLKQGRWIKFADTGYSREICISEYAAKNLDMKTGDSMLVYFLRDDGSRTARRLIVSGLFRTGIDAYDKNFAICDIGLIRRLNNLPSNYIGGYELLLEHYKTADSTAAKIYDELPQSWYARSIREVYPQIFDWLGLQEQIKWILIGIMLVVAILNLITCLVILALERTSMIGILKALGAKDIGIQKIFLTHSMFIAAAGIVFGNILGLGICWLQQATGFIKLNEEAYYMDMAAAVIDPWQILLIDAGTPLIIALTLLIPTLIIRRVSVVKAVQFK